MNLNENNFDENEILNGNNYNKKLDNGRPIDYQVIYNVYKLNLEYEIIKNNTKTFKKL